MDGPAKTRGRPRNATIDGQVRASAIEVYGRQGWAGYSFDAVAGHSGVGKPAIYRRWDSKEHLLSDAITSLTAVVFVVDTGTLQEDLRLLALRTIEWQTSGPGLAWNRLRLEQAAEPKLRKIYLESDRKPVADARKIIARAIDRGEIPAEVDPDLMLEAISGAIYTRFVSADAGQPKTSDEAVARYVTRLIDVTVLGSVSEAESRRRPTV